jgi:hypothetical protein
MNMSTPLIDSGDATAGKGAGRTEKRWGQDREKDGISVSELKPRLGFHETSSEKYSSLEFPNVISSVFWQNQTPFHVILAV